MESPDTRQLRLALSMNGGVSLAVWIGGAVCEIDQLRRAFHVDSPSDSFWRRLSAACGYDSVQVDVLTGASAGGLNGVLMAEAIRTDTNFDTFRTLWEDAADIEQLIKHPRTALERDPRSVLRGGYFLREVESALDQLGEPTQPEHDLALFASATRLSALAVQMHDSPGEPIAERRSDAYFHVAKRGPAAQGLDGFAAADNRRYLARIARATSSLPGLFEPVEFTHDDSSERLVGGFAPGEHSAEIIDGGVIDNVPIARAIRAIAQSKADRRVRRVLLYLHPDPSVRDERARPGGLVGVVKRFGSKRKESIRDDIDLLREHNAAARLRASMAELLSGQIGCAVPAGTYAAGRIEADKALLVRAATDPAAAMPWHAVGVPRRTAIIDLTSLSIGQLRNSLGDHEWAMWRVAGAQQRRVIGVLFGSARQAEQMGTVGASEAKAQLYRLALVADLAISYQLAAFLHPAGGVVATRIARLAEARRTVESADFAAQDTVRLLAEWQDTIPPDGAGLTTFLDDGLNEIIELLGEAVPGTGQDERTVERLDAVYLSLTSAPVASDSVIEFGRIVGTTDSPAMQHFVSRGAQRAHKLAGWQLGHTGAFFRKEWRTNDWMWGRLDAAHELIDVLLGPGQSVPPAVFSEFDLPRGLGRDDVRHVLSERRQHELLGDWLHAGSENRPATLVELAASAPFRRWAGDRRVLHAHIGEPATTSIALRLVLTAWRVAMGNGKKRFVAAPFRGVVLASVGVILAGRRATVAVAATLCAMAAPRVGYATGWVVWVVGVALCLLIAVLVECLVKPDGRSSGWYLLALAVVASGAICLATRDQLVEARWPGTDVRLWWTIPALAAGLTMSTLVFWMHRGVAWALSLGTAAFYGLVAWLALPGPGTTDPRAPWWWMRSLWLAWLVAVVVVPSVIAQMPNRWLGGPILRYPDAASRDADG
jgi:hypothetical protein